MVFLAALTFVGLQEKFGLPLWGAFPLTLGVMVLLGIGDRARGAAASRESAADHTVHGDHRARILPGRRSPSSCGAPKCGASTSACRTNPSNPMMDEDSTCSSASSTSWLPWWPACWWRCWRCSSTRRASGAPCARWRTTTKRLLRSGIPLKQIWAIVWSVAGFVALVAGLLLWGARNGVQFALTFVALKALPVLILGGFESVLGAPSSAASSSARPRSWRKSTSVR